MQLLKLNLESSLVDDLLIRTGELLKALKKPNNSIEILEKSKQVEIVRLALVETQVKRKSAERPVSGVPI